jgi:type III secretion system YscD/HrpQ family protein
MNALLELRFLGGPAVGAAIELGAGSYVLGSDDSCDFVLADETVAGQHLRLEVQVGAEGIPGVTAYPLEGALVLNGLEVPKEGALLPQGEALGLGFTALAWQLPDAAWGKITLVPLEFAQALGRAGLPPTMESRHSPEFLGEADAVENTGTEEKSAEEAEADETASSAFSFSHRAVRSAGAGVFLLLLGVLLYALFATPPFTREVTARALGERLAAAGFTGVRAEDGEGYGAVVLRGAVADDLALQALLRQVGAPPFRVHVDVRVENDRLRAVRETFQAHGFFPAVRQVEKDQLALALYLKDGLVEAQMLEVLSRDVPRLKAASRKVIYARDLSPVLNAELQKIGLDGGRITYLAGKVLYPFQLDPTGQEHLEEALQQVQKTLGAPVFFQAEAKARAERYLAAEAPRRLAATSDAASPDGDIWGGLKVMGVTLGVMPFVTTNDQQKFFPGAVLPGGASLVSIHADHLVILNGQETLTYFLKEE